MKQNLLGGHIEADVNMGTHTGCSKADAKPIDTIRGSIQSLAVLGASGVYQIGDEQARSCMPGGTAAGNSRLLHAESQVLQRGVGISRIRKAIIIIVTGEYRAD